MRKKGMLHKTISNDQFDGVGSTLQVTHPLLLVDYQGGLPNRLPRPGKSGILDKIGFWVQKKNF